MSQTKQVNNNSKWAVVATAEHGFKIMDSWEAVYCEIVFDWITVATADSLQEAQGLITKADSVAQEVDTWDI